MPSSTNQGSVTAGVVVGIVVITWALRRMPMSAADLWKIGFGAVDGRNLLTTNMSLLSTVLVTNSPQLVLSYLYVAFNRLYTSMLLGKEWSSYLHNRKPLRVSRPAGQQRSTYWLSVPFRYAIPMLLISGLFHWLASQSLFMVQITVTRTEGSGARLVVPTEQISTCGYSPFAIIFSTATATVIAIGGIIMGRFKYPVGMPLASSCSAVISAACHPLSGEKNAHLLPVQWGVMTRGPYLRDGADQRVRHCGFSSEPVRMPIPGHLYA